jgi:large subunit ribosomal protein L22
MPFTAKHRFARIAPRKARLIMDLVRGRDVDDALSILRFQKQRSVGMIEKVIRSAVANAAEQSTAPAKGVYYIAEARVDGGPVIKRFMPKDRGKAYDIKKRTSHFVVTIDERDPASEPVVSRKKKTNKQKKAEAAEREAKALAAAE